MLAAQYPRYDRRKHHQRRYLERNDTRPIGTPARLLQTRMSSRCRRPLSGLVLAVVVATPLVACSGTSLHDPVGEDATMNIEQSHRDVVDIVTVIQGVVGKDGWGDEDAGWNICSSDGTAAAQFTYTTTRKLPLPGTPDEVAGKVTQALDTLGYRGAHVQHDTTLTPERTVIGYPNGYNGGASPDKFAIQFQVNDGYADLSVYGHCVPGNVPKLGTRLNPLPSELR